MMDFPMESEECKAQSVNPGKSQHRHMELMLMPMLMHSHLELFALVTPGPGQLNCLSCVSHLLILRIPSLQL